MGAALGLLFGVGVLLVWDTATARPTAAQPRRRTTRERTAELLGQAGLSMLRPGQLWLMCAATAVVGAVVVLIVSHSTVVATAGASFAGYAPVAWVRSRRRHRTAELRDVWPDVVDNLASAVRAGLALPEAVAQIGQRGPTAVREPFRRFADDYRASGRFSDCLDELKNRLADPVADRVIESLRVAREVGGTDLGRVLRTLSQFLREDARTRAELETRQGWTVNAARLALAAPWVVLALLSLRPETVVAYDSAAGVLVLAGGGGVSFAAYRLMLRIARLPLEERVLR
ncbi:MAG TPA: type II secretion system F family protein [Mycobacteriales bacterium]|nr:type II secretion system F family protein [Mycobacteriales bacterium]